VAASRGRPLRAAASSRSRAMEDLAVLGFAEIAAQAPRPAAGARRCCARSPT
jgi:hypothetical protein